MTDGRTTRRAALGAMAGFATAGMGAAAGAARAETAPDAGTGAAHAVTTQLSPDEALELLKAGNDEFLTDAPYRQAQGRERRLEIAEAQAPFAVLIGCSDSRVSPELLFGRGLGELFIVRVAGNTVDLAALGSVEYAVHHLGVPLIVVLGHERCGAVAAAVDVVEKNATFPGRIGDMVEPIIPAVLSARTNEGLLLHDAVRANVERVVAGLSQSSPMIAEQLAAGRLKVVGAIYDLEDGRVTFFGVA